MSDITAGTVVWNEGHRLGHLLEVLRPFFDEIVAVVQESTDDTLQIAIDGADRVIPDEHRGIGDASMPLLLSNIRTRWTFIISGDELPNRSLLESLQDAVDVADKWGYDGIWIPFRSIIEGVEYNEQHSHLRLFHTSLGWPATMHSRPTPTKERFWETGYIMHERSLDEMMIDYLRYYELGRGNANWEAHNRTMMHDACVSVAGLKGWDFVTSHAWWPQVKEIAFPR